MFLVIQAAIFDMDGVVIDTEPVHDRLWQKFFSELGVVVAEKDFPKMRGVLPESTIRHFMSQLTDAQEIERLRKKREAMVAEAFIQETIPLVRGVREFILALKRENISLALATATIRPTATQVLKKIGLYDYFDTLVCGDEIRKSKPDPEIFLTAASKLGVLPAECVVFEDAIAGVEAGKRAGMETIALLTSQKKEEFPYPDITAIHDFTEIRVSDLFRENNSATGG